MHRFLHIFSRIKNLNRYFCYKIFVPKPGLWKQLANIFICKSIKKCNLETIYRFQTYMLWMLSVRFVSKLRNCFPFFVYPRISAPAATKIFSDIGPSKPPSSSLVIFVPGNVLNKTCCENRMQFSYTAKSLQVSEVASYEQNY